MRIAVPFATNPPLFGTLCWMDRGNVDAMMMLWASC